jgi:CRISPR/Cas system-associated exonuclease Cas4 (RecB family)
MLGMSELVDDDVMRGPVDRTLKTHRHRWTTAQNLALSAQG